MSPPITIVSGFLGSGKTTLLRALIESGADGRRLGLVVNEFGEVGFDGQALERSGAPMIELSGGCICCAAGSDFLVAVEDLIDMTDIDQIVVETTGLAEPGGIIRQVRSAGLGLDAVVTVASAPDLETALAAAPVAEWQIRAADILVLSKIDLVADAGASATERLRTLNSRAALLPSIRGFVSPALLFGPRLIDTETPDTTPGHLAHTDFSSVIWAGAQPLRRAALEQALSELPRQIYRAKGLIQCSDAPWADEVQFVAGRYDLSAVRLKNRPIPLNRLVFIGTGIDALADELRARLDACADSTERIAAWQGRNLS